MTDSHVRPKIQVLTPAQIATVHAASLDILASVGLQVDSERAREVLSRASGTRLTGDRVYLPRELVEWALSVAPEAIQVYNRGGERAFCLGQDTQTRFGVGVTALYYQDPLTDQVTPFARRHMRALVRLGQALPSYDVVSTVGIVQDVPTEWADLYATLEMTANTSKPLVILVSDEERFPSVLDLLEHLHGDLAPRPHVIPYFNPISPLVLNQGTVDKMVVTIERGLPFIFSNYGMAGATTPVIPAGSLTLLNAELLAGLTLSQLIQEGTPIILGSLPAFFDMRGSGSFYDLSSYTLNLACAEMMAHYRLPHCGTSGSGMGWGADMIAGGHQWVNHLSSCLGKVGLAPFVGDNLGSKAFSPAIVVYADQIIAQTRRLAQGFSLEDLPIALDEIAQIGPGGHFLNSELTFRRFRQAYYHNPIWPNLSLEAWQERGGPQPDDLLRKQTQELLDSLVAPDDYADLIARGESFIAGCS